MVSFIPLFIFGFKMNHENQPEKIGLSKVPLKFRNPKAPENPNSK